MRSYIPIVAALIAQARAAVKGFDISVVLWLPECLTGEAGSAKAYKSLDKRFLSYIHSYVINYLTFI